MTNADRFKGIFGIYATELWAKSEKEFLEWLNEDVPDTNVGDMIGRQAAIDALCNDYCGGHQDCKYYPKCENLKSIQKLPSAQLEQQWIPCSEFTGEGYPKENGFYYVTERNYGFYLDADSKQNVAHTSRFFNGDFTDRFYDENHSNIVAWLPLPDPYKAEREEE